jgi:hypothetical protein
MGKRQGVTSSEQARRFAADQNRMPIMTSTSMGISRDKIMGIKMERRIFCCRQ